MQVHVHTCAVPVLDWSPSGEQIERPCGSEAIPGIPQNMCSGHYGRWLRSSELKAPATRYCSECNRQLSGTEDRKHERCAEAAEKRAAKELRYGRCVSEGCDRGVGPNGRYCLECVLGASKPEAQRSESDRAILDYLAVRNAPEHLKTVREFDRTDLDDTARVVGNQRAAGDLVNDWANRHPDGLIWLGRTDMVLAPCWSPKAHQWVIFKCERDSAKGRRFRLIPLTYQALDRLDEGDLMHVRMDDAWELASTWQRELADAWMFDQDSIWEAQFDFGMEVFAQREQQRRDRVKPYTVALLTDEEGHPKLKRQKHAEVAHREHFKRVTDGSFTRDSDD